MAAATGVILSYLFQMEAILAWGGLAIAFLALFLKLILAGYRSVKTPFDIAMVLMVGGGLVGLWVSPTLDLSLGAFQSLLAVTLIYYSVGTYYRPALLMKWGLPLFAMSLLGATFFAFSRGPLPSANLNFVSLKAFQLAQLAPKLPQFSSQPNLAPGVTHGLALTLFVAAAIVGGFAVFGKWFWLRLLSGVMSAVFLAVMVMFTNESIMGLFTKSMEGRLPLWHDTVQMLKGHPFTGLGLGSWAWVHNSAVVPYPSHPHNAYLELYTNTGVLGLLAFFVSLVVGVRLGWDILRSPRSSLWYGLGVGVLLACLISASVGFVESAPVGIPLLGAEAYFYVVSPLPWMLAALLVVAHGLLKGNGVRERRR